MESLDAENVYAPSGWTYKDEVADYLEQQGTLRRLTEEEVVSLRRGEPIPNSVSQQEFPNCKTFLCNQNSFVLYFIRSGFLHVTRARSLQFQRFEILYPEQAQRLQTALSISSTADMYAAIELVADDLFDAYQKMSLLVSATDWNVARMTADEQHWALTI